MRSMRTVVRLFVAALFITSAAAPHAASPQPAEMPITTTSEEARAAYVRARDFLENVELAAAVPLLEQAIAKDQTFGLAYAGLANAGLGFVEFRKNAAAAVAQLDRVSPGERLILLALKAQVDNDPAARREHAEALARMFPKDKHAHFFAGQVARTTGDVPGALAHYKHAVAIDTRYAAAHNMLGYAYIALDDLKAAERAFQSYISLRPDTANPYDSYGELLQKMGRFEESTAQYRKALERDPGFSSAMIRIGDNSLFKGDGAAAREGYRMALDRARNDADRAAALNAVQDSYLYEGKTTEALAANEELRALAEKAGLAPVVFGSHMSAAFIHSEAGAVAEAKRQIAMALAANDAATLSLGAKDGNRMNAALSMARVLSRSGDAAGADAQIRAAQAIAAPRKIAAEQRAIEETTAFLALDRKQYDAALQHFAKGETDDGYLMYYTAVAYEAKGDAASARKKYAQAAAWNQPDLGYATVRARAIKKAAEKAPK